MKRLVFVSAAISILCGCASESMKVKLPPAEGSLPPEAYVPTPQHRIEPGQEQTLQKMSIAELQNYLGLNRSPQDLGFDERFFDGCQIGVKGEKNVCAERYLAVVHFRLMCRDTVGTTSRVPSSLRPLSAGNMHWRLAGVQGNTKTDKAGFGQVRVVASRSAKTERFMLTIGTKSLGVEAGEVSQIVVPDNWCRQHLAAN